MRLGKLRWLLSVLALVALGCDGTSTGNPNKNNGTDEGDPGNTGKPGETTDKGSRCMATSTAMLALSDSSPLGVSAETLLAPLRSPRQEALTWLPARGANYGPETGTQMITLSMTPVTGSARFVTSMQTGEGEIWLNCGARLEIDVDVLVKSSGGALNETIRTTLVASQPDVAGFSARLEPEKLGGTFTYTPTGFTDPRYTSVKVALTLNMQLSAYGVSGSLSTNVEFETADSVGEGSGSVLARFGLAGCDDGIAVPLDATGLASSQAALALLREHRHATATALDGSEHEVDLSFSAQTACLLIEQAPRGTMRKLRLSGTLAASSGDGRFSASWPVLAQTPVDESGSLPPTLSFLLDYNEPLAGTTLEERYGLSGINVSSYDESGASVMLGLSSTGGWSGDVIAYGITLPNCPAPVPGSNSSPGCPGSERQEVEHYTFH